MLILFASMRPMYYICGNKNNRDMEIKIRKNGKLEYLIDIQENGIVMFKSGHENGLDNVTVELNREVRKKTINDTGIDKTN